MTDKQQSTASTASATRTVITPPVLESSASLRSPRIDALLAESPDFARRYEAMLRGIAANVRFPPTPKTERRPTDNATTTKENAETKGSPPNDHGPSKPTHAPTFTATSGLSLPYYLSLVTSFLDPRVSTCVVDVLSTFLLALPLEPRRRWVLVGMEVAGGMLVSQLACVPKLATSFAFVYMRKNRKSSGTAQQLEGPREFTDPDFWNAGDAESSAFDGELKGDTQEETRNASPSSDDDDDSAHSPVNETPSRRRRPATTAVDAIWIDDCCSTGSSLRAGIRTLREEYRMNVRYAVFVVDRSRDRVGLDPAKRFLDDPQFQPLARGGGGTTLAALADLADVEAFVNFPDPNRVRH